MRGRNRRAHVLGLVIVATAASACGPTLDPESEERDLRDPAVWVVVSDDIATEVQEFLGPTENGEESRAVASANERTVVLLREHELEGLSAFFHDTFHRCGGFTTHASLERARRDLVAEPPEPAAQGLARELELAEPEVVQQLIPLVDAAQILATITGLSSFPTRHYQTASGLASAEWLRDQWIEIAASRPDATVELYDHPWIQSSVIMTIPGDELPDEVVVIGGHLDSITFSGGQAPGADDDASGIASLTEAARVLLSQNIRLRRTLKFMAYAGEEAGLRGSDEIAEDFAAQNINVVGVMQLDMTNYDGSPHDIVLITDNVDQQQTQFLGTLATTYLPQFPLSNDACGYACSDHASWTRAGYPAVFPFEATMDTYNPTIHSSGDRLSVSGNNANHASKFAKLALAYLVEMAEVPGDVEPPPDPTARIYQVAYDVPGLDRLHEFIDLTNTGAQAINVGGWTLSNANSTWTIPAGTTIAAGGFLTVATDAAGFGSLYGGAPDVSGVSFLLPNSNGQLRLRDPAGTEIDFVGWERVGWPLNAATGKSILRSALSDSDTSADWTVSSTVDPAGGSSLQ
jgi:leucyl aminopeptidase